VIVTAGAIGTPKLLLLSGIGAASVLAPHGIAVVHELNGVGRNLNDHVNVMISAFVNTPTYNTQRRGVASLRHGARLLTRGRGPASSPANHAQGFVKTDPALASADVQVQLMAFGFGTDEEMRRDGMTAVVSPCRPLARGQVQLHDADPAAPPRITMAMLGQEADIDTLVRGCKLTVEMLQAGPGREFAARIYAPAKPASTKAEWVAYFRATAALNWHPTSTCRMGPARDDGAVVDARLAVHGLAGLSIADASVMPNVTSANTNIPVIAIAERAAGFIAARTG
jgi:choline dehydrogenase